MRSAFPPYGLGDGAEDWDSTGTTPRIDCRASKESLLVKFGDFVACNPYII